MVSPVGWEKPSTPPFEPMDDSPILIAPTLLSENWLSMNIYSDALQNELVKIPGLNWANIAPVSTVGDSRWKRLFQRNIEYPWTVRRHDRPGSVLHVLDHSNAHLCRYHRNSLVTCHDIAEFRQTKLSARQFRNWKWRVEGMRHARKILTVSQCTKEDLIEILGIPAERIDVCHNGVDPLFQPAQREAALAHFPQLGLSELKILHVGSNIYRKNVELLIRALGILARRKIGFRFVKVGLDFTDEQKRLMVTEEIAERVIHLGKAETTDLPAIYSLCDVFAFPSIYEGFGLPVLEAQACGLPTVIAQTSALPEVGGDASLYTDPHDPEELAEKLIAAAKPDEARRLRNLGFANVKRFTWRGHAETVARTYLDLFS